MIWNLKSETAFRNVTITRDRGGYWESWKRAAKTDPRAAGFVTGYQHRPAFELFDLTEDPLELHNLVSAPAHAKLRTDLHTRLKAWMRDQGDRGIETEMAVRPRRRR